jgi:lipopolysaccharide export LptBFGC system permease protein LptF
VSAPVILAVRVLVSVLFALFIAYFFFRNTSVFLVLGMSIALLGLAYLLEYLRKRNENQDP